MKNLAEQCLGLIPGIPEIANLVHTGNWAITAELKDEEGNLHEALVYWRFDHTETEKNGFVLFGVVIGVRQWYFRGRRCDYDHSHDHMFYVGTTPKHRLAYTAWYEGDPVDLARDTCTRCDDTRSSTVQQAYCGGAPIKGVAHCQDCRQAPYPEMRPPYFNKNLVPSR